MNMTTKERVSDIRARFLGMFDVPDLEVVDIKRIEALIIELHKVPHSQEQQELQDALLISWRSLKHRNSKVNA